MTQLMQGDCLELIKEIPDGVIDLVLTDPPYGIDFQSQRKKDKTKWMPKIKNDKEPFTAFIQELPRIINATGAVMIFTRWDVQQKIIDAMTENGMRPKNIIIWDKVIHGMGDLLRAYGSRYESIVFWANKDFRFNGKRPTDIIRCQRVPACKLTHPNEKPVELLGTLIQQCTKPGDTVLDMFMGSGSTGVACAGTGRNFIGMELDVRYYKNAHERIMQAEKTG